VSARPAALMPLGAPGSITVGRRCLAPDTPRTQPNDYTAEIQWERLLGNGVCQKGRFRGCRGNTVIPGHPHRRPLARKSASRERSVVATNRDWQLRRVGGVKPEYCRMAWGCRDRMHRTPHPGRCGLAQADGIRYAKSLPLLPVAQRQDLQAGMDRNAA
jgi:hypothetical protein